MRVCISLLLGDIDMTSTAITAQPVESNSFLMEKIGKHCILWEASLFSWADKLCPDYHGGQWDIISLSNSGFYYQPPLEDEVLLVSPNGSSKTVSKDAAGITISLFAFNHLTYLTQDKLLNDLFYQLRSYAFEHDESSAIFAIID